MKENVIVTASDKKYGDFLIEHWYASLRDNCDLSCIDICVLDFGLSKAQRFFCEHNNIKVFTGRKDGHVVIIRFRELYAMLSAHDYDQVLLCDSGDMIFQKDISPIFFKNKDTYRAVEEDIKSPFSLFITDEFFEEKMKKKLTECLISNKMINAGFILGSRRKMMFLCDMMMKMIKKNEKFGPDQIVVNYVLHENGFIPLNKAYNFVISTAREYIEIRDGVFYFSGGDIIPVVHNTGNVDFFRVIENFGYGKNYNILKEDVYRALKAINKSSDSFYKAQEEFYKRRKDISGFLVKHIKELKEKYKKSKELINEELKKLIKE